MPLGALGRGGQQAALADPGRALDDQHARRDRMRRASSAASIAGQLGLALEQHDANPTSKIVVGSTMRAAARGQRIARHDASPPPLPPPSPARSSTPSRARPTRSPSARSTTTLSYTWAELAERVAIAAGALRARGVRPGDTVALLLTNRPELWVADLAVTMCGATTCPLYTTLPPNDVEFVVGDAGARLIVTERALLRAAPATCRCRCS